MSDKKINKISNLEELNHEDLKNQIIEGKLGNAESKIASNEDKSDNPNNIYIKENKNPKDALTPAEIAELAKIQAEAKNNPETLDNLAKKGSKNLKNPLENNNNNIYKGNGLLPLEEANQLANVADANRKQAVQKVNGMIDDILPEWAKKLLS